MAEIPQEDLLKFSDMWNVWPKIEGKLSQQNQMLRLLSAILHFQEIAMFTKEIGKS